MVVIDGDPASDEVRFSLIMVKHQATLRTAAPKTAFGFGGVSYVEIDGAFGAVFLSHVTSPVIKRSQTPLVSCLFVSVNLL